MKRSDSKEIGRAEDEEIPQRGHWGSPLEFILSCLGYAVGLGNVWRFPYMTYTNGGGAFLIPYFIMLTLVGIPVFLIELAIGQYSGCGPATVWEVAPLLKGVGWGQIAMPCIGSVYYNFIITWSLFYLFASFQSVLPWAGCTHEYNTAYCYSKAEAADCENGNGTWFNQTCYNATYIASFESPGPPINCSLADDVTISCQNSTINPLQEYLNNVSDSLVSPSEEYFNWYMLDRTDSISDTGRIKWDLVLTLILAWIICYLCILKGIRSSGKVVYFTATFPYLLLVILFFRAVLLENAGEGVEFYIVPRFEHLAKPKVWADAAGQIFFSLSVGGGGLMTFASYNRFNNNIYRDTLLVSIGNCMTSFFAGFAIFSILGFMASQLDTDVHNVVASGSGLAFIAFPAVVTHLPLPQFWSALFFFMLITLGLDSQFASLENLQTAITDTWPETRRYKWLTALIICTCLFLLGLTQTTQAGIYWTELMAYYSSGWSLILMGTVEAVVFPWVYGADNLMDNIEAMVGFRLGRHWYYTWKYITPLVLLVILLVNFAQITPLSFGDIVIEEWAQVLGWLMALFSISFIPLGVIIVLWQSYSQPEYDGLTFCKRIVTLCKPTDKWGPAIDRENREDLEAIPGDKSQSANATVKYDNPGFSGSSQDIIQSPIKPSTIMTAETADPTFRTNEHGRDNNTRL